MQGIVQRAVVGNDGICRCQIQRTALCFHLAQCVHAGRKRPAAAHGQCIHRPVDEQNDTVLVQSTQILRLFYNAAAAGNELSALFAKALCFGSFLCAEAVLALGCKDIRDAAAVGLTISSSRSTKVRPRLFASSLPRVVLPQEASR